MTLLTPELMDTGEKRAKNGKLIIPAVARAGLIAEYEASGLTQRAFAQREGLSFCTFTTWLARHRKAQRKSPFTEVSLAPPHWTSRRGPALSDHLLDRRFLSAPKDRSARLFARCSHALADDDDPRRPGRPHPSQLATRICSWLIQLSPPCINTEV